MSNTWAKLRCTGASGNINEQVEHEPTSQKDLGKLACGDPFIPLNRDGGDEGIFLPPRAFRHHPDCALQILGANTIVILAYHKVEPPVATKTFEEKSRLPRTRGIAKDSEASR